MEQLSRTPIGNTITDKARSRRPTILMVASDLPLKVGHGTAMRTYCMALGLAKVSDLTLVLSNPEGATDLPRELVQVCSKVIYSPPQSNDCMSSDTSRIQRWIRAIATLAMPWRHGWEGVLSQVYASAGLIQSELPLSRRLLIGIARREVAIAARFFDLTPRLAFFHRKGMNRLSPTIEHLVGSNAYDIVWVEHAINLSFFDPVAPQLSSPFLVCNTHNIESRLAAQQAKFSLPKLANLLKTEAMLLHRAEGRAFKRSDLVVTCSEEDRKAALDIEPTCRVVVIPNGVDTSYFRTSTTARYSATPSILFTGVFDYSPNVDAVRFFVDEILPRVHEAIPDVEFVFAGRGARAAASSLMLIDKGVRFVSDPADMRGEFEKAWVYAVPLRQGGGTRIKILEAMAMERAVVSTSIGASGVPYIPGEHLIIADTPGEFAAAVVRLLQNPAERRTLGQAGAQFVRARYDWTVLSQKVSETVSTLVGSAV